MIWPVNWKVEHVTVIPKNSCPSGFEELRNISCTLLVSKILESYVLEWAMEEVTTKYNQYGGVRGCSGAHLVLKLWQKILSNLEDRRAATILTSIDYAKAFNRLSFQHCLRAFAEKGASTPILRLLATFLTNRRMRVRVGQSWSQPRSVTGGCPQGSILGVFLFNITTDDLEDGSSFTSSPGAPMATGPAGEDECESDLDAPADNPEDHYRPGWDRRSSGDASDESGWGEQESGESDSTGSDTFHTARSSLSASDVLASTPQLSLIHI